MAVAEEIKNGINNEIYGVHSTSFHSTNNDYDYPPDAMVNRPTIYAESDDSFDSDDDYDDDDYVNPELFKSSSSFGKSTLVNSLKRNFSAKNKVKQDSGLLQVPLINDYSRINSTCSIQHARQSTTHHLKVHSEGTLKFRKSKSHSNPCLK